RNYDVRPLPLGPDATTVPDDADVVVVAAPRRELPAKAVESLRRFLRGTGRKDKGRLVVLMPPAADARGEPIRTGLEKLLAEDDTQVGETRVMAFMGVRPPLTVIAMANPQVTNPIAQAFQDVSGFAFDDSREVRARRTPGGPGAAFTAEDILVVPDQTGVW